ncbi:MAG TPA: undecaprenyl-diphosphate phosphatase [Gemmatimonadales bacterium]|nr:undecaprenyl-diphosphate phosphatase [Gemmatimonadales bacterium]
MNHWLAGLPPELQATLLGLVEGITEFIPVSSTGHLILAGHLMGWTDARAKTFEIFIQLGAILAIVWLYRARLGAVLMKLGSDAGSRRFAWSLFLAFLPAAVVGFLIHGFIKEHLFDPTVVAWALVVGGVAILIIERVAPESHTDDAFAVTPRTALGIGLAQVLSLIPGTSRSGATIMGAYCLGLSRRAATEFSFFLAIPVMVAATLYDLVSSGSALAPGDGPIFAIGFITAFISALVVVRAFLRFVSHASFAPFAWYRIAFGFVLLLIL